MFDKNLLELPGMRAAFGAMALFSVLTAAFALGEAISLSYALANMWNGEPVAGQTRLLAVFFACLVLRRAVAFAREEMLEKTALKAGSALESQVLAAAFSDDASLARSIGTAATAQAATEGIDDIQRYVRVIPPKLCDMAIMSLALVVALFAIDWVSGLITLVAFPVTIMFMVVLGRQARARAERQYEASTVLANHFIDTLRGIEELDALGATERSARSVYDTSEKLRVATVRTLSVATLSSAVLDLVNVFAVAACAMMLAFRLMDASIALPTALCALILAPEALAPLRSFASEFHASLDGKTALASVLSLIEGNRQGDGKNGGQENFGDWGDWSGWSKTSSLSLDGASYRYEGSSRNALEDVALTLRGHEHVAVVGSSGSGKTTLADIVAGFRKADSGRITIDGREVESLNLDSWKRQIAYIPQNPYLFKTTLRENLAFYAPEATEEEIEQAIDDAGLRELMAELPFGLETVLGDGERGLSGGQAQRIALARALLSKRPILIFDEPTAHLDIETEIELKQTMLAAMDGRLVVFATHRLHWLEDMDRIIVLEEGRIVDEGTYDQLSAESAALARFISGETHGVMCVETQGAIRVETQGDVL